MRTDQDWLDVLERQAATVDALSTYIGERQALGRSHESTSLRLSEEKKLYRRLLSQCPVETLFRFACTAHVLRHD